MRDDRQVGEIAVSSASLAGACGVRMPFQEGDDLVGYVIGEWVDPVVSALETQRLDGHKRTAIVWFAGHSYPDDDIDVEAGELGRSKEGDNRNSSHRAGLGDRSSRAEGEPEEIADLERSGRRCRSVSCSCESSRTGTRSRALVA